ncbi:MAG: ABC transporter substrate-binding protein, partial [Desulfovermiculus sp.]
MMDMKDIRLRWLGPVGLACFSAVLCILIGWNTAGYAQEDKGPAPVVSAYYEQVRDVLTDKGLDKDQLREELQSMAREIFTFEIMAQMSLGRNWQDLDSDEQDEFVTLFTRLLENTYFQKLEEHLSEVREYSDDDMQVTDEIVFSSRKAEVQSKIVYDDKDVPVDYRFVKTDDEWKIYDVLVEEVSLVQNYRSQFNDRLQKVSVAELMQEMRDKVQKLESGEEEDPEL